ncbi:DMT family transporter [Planktotalea sp.]|uniref:DMT family transporter n=1 Tax=Planktotalea sp. TaxID=2029877 RepID=UPI0032982917
MTSLPTHNPRLAMMLMICATAFIAATTLFAKAIGTGALGEPLHPLQITHGRFLFAALTFSCAAMIMRPSFGKVHIKLHLFRTSCGAAGVTLMFASVAFIPLSDATAISFLNPVFAMIFAIFLLGETIGPVRWSAAGIAMIGALILLRPGSGSIAPGALLALGAALMLGLEVVFIKKLTGQEAPFQILLINNLIGLLIASLAVLTVWQPPTLAQWGALFGVGTCMAVAQTCFLNSVARADASFVVPFSYGTLLFAALYDSFIFGVTPDAISFVGAGVIIAGAALLAWREARLSKA